MEYTVNLKKNLEDFLQTNMHSNTGPENNAIQSMCKLLEMTKGSLI